jgi:hypothetical protein
MCTASSLRFQDVQQDPESKEQVTCYLQQDPESKQQVTCYCERKTSIYIQFVARFMMPTSCPDH